MKEKMLGLLKDFKICKMELKEKVRMFKEYHSMFNSIYIFSKKEFLEVETEELEFEGANVSIKKVHVNLISFVSGDLVPAVYLSEKKELTEEEQIDIAKLKVILEVLNYNIK